MTPTHDGATPHDHRGHALGHAPLLQWLGLLLAPAVFLTHLEVGYLLTIRACDADLDGAWVHLAAGLAVLLAGAGTVAAWITWARVGRHAPGDGASIDARTRLLGVAGLAVGAVLTLVLFAQLLSGFVVPRCQ